MKTLLIKKHRISFQKKQSPRSFLALALICTTLTSCTVAQTRPVQELSNAEAAIKAAKDLNAESMPPESGIPELMRNAVDYYFRAKREYRLKNFSQAKIYAEKAMKLAERAEFKAYQMGGANPDSTLFTAPEGASADPEAALIGNSEKALENQKESKSNSRKNHTRSKPHHDTEINSEESNTQPATLPPPPPPHPDETTRPQGQTGPETGVSSRPSLNSVQDSYSPQIPIYESKTQKAGDSESKATPPPEIKIKDLPKVSLSSPEKAFPQSGSLPPERGVPSNAQNLSGSSPIEPSAENRRFTLPTTKLIDSAEIKPMPTNEIKPLGLNNNGEQEGLPNLANEHLDSKSGNDKEIPQLNMKSLEEIKEHL